MGHIAVEVASGDPHRCLVEVFPDHYRQYRLFSQTGSTHADAARHIYFLVDCHGNVLVGVFAWPSPQPHLYVNACAGYCRIHHLAHLHEQDRSTFDHLAHQCGHHCHGHDLLVELCQHRGLHQASSPHVLDYGVLFSQRVDRAAIVPCG